MIEGFALQAGSYSAEALRRATMGIFLERGPSIGSVVGGLVGATDLQTKAGIGMNVETSPGECVVNQAYSTSGGPNYIRLTSTLTSKVPAASPTLPRVDLLCAQIDDAAYHGSLNEYAISYLEGTPTSGANLTNKSGAPTLPTSALALAYVLVPANAASLTNEDIENAGKVLHLQTGAVGGAQLIAGAVTEAKIANEAVTDAKVVKGSLLIKSESKYATETQVEVINPSKIIKLNPSASRPSILLARSTTSGPIFIEADGVIVSEAGGEGKGTAIAWLEPNKEGFLTTAPSAKNTAAYTLITL